MPDIFFPNDQARMDEMQRQLDDIRRQLVPPFKADTTIVFSHAGALTASTSPRYYFGKGARVVRVVASLSTAGSSNTVLTVARNGISIGTITLGSGVNFVSTAFNHTFAADQDYLTVAITTAGTGAKDLTVEARAPADT